MQMNLFENIKIFIEIVDAGSFARGGGKFADPPTGGDQSTAAAGAGERGPAAAAHHPASVSYAGGGKSFIVAANRCSPGADDLLESFAPDRPIRGQLRVDMPIAFARLLVIPHLPDFYQAHPEVEIVLSSSDVRRDMLRDGLDCLLRVGDLEDGDYVARSLGRWR